MKFCQLQTTKKIVENNQGVQEDRGSQIPIKLTGAIAEKEGFKISYSTDEPGSNQNESWNKNFVDKTAITDWSKVRMVKIEQKTNYSVPAQTVVNFDFTAQIDPKAADNTIANNSVAVTISASGNLVESDPVEAKVEYPTTIEGIAFEDNNKNNVFDENIDTLLPDLTPLSYLKTPTALLFNQPKLTVRVIIVSRLKILQIIM